MCTCMCVSKSVCVCVYVYVYVYVYVCVHVYVCVSNARISSTNPTKRQPTGTAGQQFLYLNCCLAQL